jgi:esterase
MASYQDCFATVNGLRLHYLDWGTAGQHPMIFLHGGSAYAHWWDWVAPAFAADFHVLALDQRGHGDSAHVDRQAYGTRHYVAEVRQFVLSLGLHKAVLIGHSMGGHNALIYAAQHARELAALIVVDTAASYSEEAVRFLGKLAAQPAREFASLEDAVDLDR